MPDPPDPLTRKLAAFTPAAPGFDRDELLFRAGRASARTGRVWRGVAALLLVTNAATLTVWLTDSRRTAPAVAQPQPAPPAPPAEPPPAEVSPGNPYWTVYAPRTGELPPPRTGTDAHLIDERPLTIRSGRTDPTDI